MVIIIVNITTARESLKKGFFDSCLKSNKPGDPSTHSLYDFTSELLLPCLENGAESPLAGITRTNFYGVPITYQVRGKDFTKKFMSSSPQPGVGGMIRKVKETVSIPSAQQWRCQDLKQSRTDLKSQAILGMCL